MTTTNSRYQHLTLEQLEAEEAALQVALQHARAMETLLAIDGPLYDEAAPLAGEA